MEFTVFSDSRNLVDVWGKAHGFAVANDGGSNNQLRHVHLDCCYRDRIQLDKIVEPNGKQPPTDIGLCGAEPALMCVWARRPRRGNCKAILLCRNKPAPPSYARAPERQDASGASVLTGVQPR